MYCFSRRLSRQVLMLPCRSKRCRNSWLSLCFLLNSTFTNLLVSARSSSIFLMLDDLSSKATTVLTLPAFCMMMSLFLLSDKNAWYSSSERFSKRWSFLLYNLKDDKPTSLVLLLRCEMNGFTSLIFIVNVSKKQLKGQKVVLNI